MEVRNTTLDDLAAIIGFTATLRLAVWFGDRKANLYVPDKVTDGQLLVGLIGESAARRLSDEFGRQHINVPGLNSALREKRYALIHQRLLAGRGSRDIAAETGLSERRVAQLRIDFERLGLLPMVLGAKTSRKTAGQNGPSD